jgi:transcriptional regulator with XRE-family HTH domain
MSDQGLTPTAAVELGRTFRFVRQAKDLTLREAAAASRVSMQYIMNIEQGSRPNVSEAIFKRLGTGYLLTTDIVDNLLLKARVLSALERRGLDPAQQSVAWKRLEAVLVDLDVNIQEGVREMVATLYG